MVRRGELTDEAWARVEPLLPEGGWRGGRWREHRTVTNGILWKLRTGAPWRDLPKRYGPWQTCYDRFVRWRRDSSYSMPNTPQPPSIMPPWLLGARAGRASAPTACSPTGATPTRAAGAC